MKYVILNYGKKPNDFDSGGLKLKHQPEAEVFFNSDSCILRIDELLEENILFSVYSIGNCLIDRS